jgi:outer membrane protein OmpA-like peptidoglycan-associated protein
MLPLALSGALALTACHKRPEAANTAAPLAAAGNTTAPAPAAPSPTAAAATPGAPFDVSKIPVSTVALGAFPYLSLPTGYEARSAKTLDIARYPVWLGDRVQWIEGKVYDAGITNVSGKDYSEYELQKNIEALVQQAGGVKITESKPSDEAVDAMSDARQTFDDSVAMMGGHIIHTFLIHQKDRDIWVEYISTDAYGAWAVIEAKPFVPTAKLLPSSALKDAIDQTGKAVIHVNFGVDQAAILPESQPQIVEVTKLLRETPPLKLSIEGHTDNSGAAAHNRQLSLARAQSVMAALVQAGVGRDRLVAKGFGADRPVADNADEAGRAQNRRVELARI